MVLRQRPTVGWAFCAQLRHAHSTGMHLSNAGIGLENGSSFAAAPPDMNPVGASQGRDGVARGLSSLPFSRFASRKNPRQKKTMFRLSLT